MSTGGSILMSAIDSANRYIRKGCRVPGVDTRPHAGHRFEDRFPGKSK